jgi:TetR/AcrR family transcriptional repressor of nem operon
MKRARPYDREAALDAALNLFWTKGYHATSLKDLEVALNMKPGSIYAAFSSKEALYLAALERYFHRSKNALRDIGKETESPIEALTGLLRQIGKGRADDPSCRACMLVKTILDTAATDAPIADQSRVYLDRMREEIAILFDLAKSKGELPSNSDPDRLARRFQAELTALRIETHRGTDKKDLAMLADDMAESWAKLRVH